MTEKCNHCPKNDRTVRWNGTFCEPCPGGKIWHSDNTCKCPVGHVVSDGICCPPATPHFYGGRCNRCPRNKPVDKKGPPPTCEPCPGQSTYNTTSKTCDLTCPAGTTAVNHICQCTDQSTPHFYEKRRTMEVPQVLRK